MTRRILSSALALAMVAVFVPPVMAGQLEDADPEISFYAMQRSRYDGGNNYFDFEDTTDSGNNDRFGFWSTRTLVGLKAHLARDVWSKVEVQHIGTFGGQTPQFSEFGMFPGDGPFFQNFTGAGEDLEDRESNVELFRAVVGMNDIGGSGLGVAVGRQKFEVGSGLLFGDESFYAGTSFDGVTGWYEWDSWKLRGSYFVTREANDPANDFNGTFGSEDEFVYGFDGQVPLNDGENNTWGDVEGHIFMLNDLQTGFNLEETAYGASWIREAYTIPAVQDNPMTWGLAFDIQDGEIEFDPNNEIDLSGGIAEGWFGWNFVSHDRFIHRPEVGFISTSGDDDVTDDDNESWSPWFGTEHCRLGCADFFTTGFNVDENGFLSSSGSGITGFWGGYTFMTNPGRHKAWVRYWSFQPTEDEVRVAPGSGGVNDIDDFGTEIDFGYSYGYSANARLFFTYAQLSPDDGLTDFDPTLSEPDDAVERIYGGLYLKFK